MAAGSFNLVFRTAKREDALIQEIKGLGVNVHPVETDEEALVHIPEANAFFGTVTPEILREGTKLRWVQAPNAGLDGFFFPELRASDVVVTNLRGIYSDMIADHVFAMILSFARGLHVYARRQAKGVWEKGAPVIHLGGKTVGVVGLGGIGLAVAERTPAFGMRAIGLDPFPKGTPAHIERVYAPDQLASFLGESDFVVICAPHTPETDKLINATTLAQMKSSAVLINIGRGKVVDLEALTHALARGTIAGAGLDVFDPEPLPEAHPLWSMENVVITPHVAAVSPEVASRRERLIVENVRRFRDGEPLLNVVDKRRGFVADAKALWT